MNLKNTALPSEVRLLRRAAYREVLALGSAFGVKAYAVKKKLSHPGEAWGLGYFVDDYLKLYRQIGGLLDKRYFHLSDAKTEAEYPFPQLRVCVNGSMMEHSSTEDLAMHQGVYINLYLLAVPAFLSGLQERNYSAVQEKISVMLKNTATHAVDEEQLRRLIRKRFDMMTGGGTAESGIKYYQIFPYHTMDYKQARIEAETLEEVLSELPEDEDCDWSAFTFDVPEDLLKQFNLPEE